MKVTTLTYKDEFIANTHIVYLTDKDVIAFDCGQSSKTFVNYISSHNLNLKAIMNDVKEVAKSLENNGIPFMDNRTAGETKSQLID